MAGIYADHGRKTQREQGGQRNKHMLKGLRRQNAYTWHVKPLLIFAVIVAALFAGGCKGSRESQLVGTWKATQGPGTMTLKEDKTFTLAGGGQQTIGKWSLDGNNVTLKPDTFGGKTKAEALKEIEAIVKKNPAAAQVLEAVKKTLEGMTMTVTEDNKKGTIDIGGGQMKLEFTKEPSK